MKIELPYDEIVAFTHRWELTEFTLFGSALDNQSDSDLGVVVGLSSDENVSLLDLGQMYSEVNELFGQKVDLVTRWGVENARNPYRKNYILETSRTIYSRQNEHEPVP